MAEYTIAKLHNNDFRELAVIKELLKRNGLDLDSHIDSTYVVYDEDNNIAATGSLYQNTLRCIAVDSSYRGENVLNALISYLIEQEYAKGYSHLFLYTKPMTAKYFNDLGFGEITRIDDTLVFMEFPRGSFTRYLKGLPKGDTRKSAAIVMNANPFTLGHRFLVESAAKEYDLVHIFVVSEDVSDIPFEVRKQLVIAGTSGIDNVTVHDSGEYIISAATFPSYFIKDKDSVIRIYAELDALLFSKIAKEMNISCRFVGSEPFSETTAVYNDILSKILPVNNIELKIISRLKIDDLEISASQARRYIKESMFDKLKKIVPDTTFDYFISKNLNK